MEILKNARMYCVEKQTAVRFYYLYREGIKKGANNGAIDFFQARSFLISEAEDFFLQGYRQAISDIFEDIERLGYTSYVSDKDKHLFHPPAVQLDRLKNLALKYEVEI